MRKYILTAAVVALSGLAAHAQVSVADPSLQTDVEQKGFLADLGANSLGELAGLPAWDIPGANMLWLQLPDGHVMGGFLFDADGRDKGAGLIDADPLDVYSTLGLQPPAHLAPLADVPAAAPQSLEDEAMRRAIGAIAELPDTEKRQQLLHLLLTMNQAGTPEEFAKGIAEWGAAATGQDATSSPAAAPAASDGSLIQPIDVMPEIGTLDMHSRIQPDLAGVAEAVASDEGDAIADRSGELLTEMKDSFWISIGQKSAPPVYMLLDPTCPYCAKSLANLQDDIEAGKIELRVVMAPLLSQRSIELVAGIMEAENPAEALWNHELAYARNGASDLPLGKFGELDKQVIDALMANRAMVQEFKLPGVPFFAWSEGGAVKLLSGVPQAGHFAKAEG